MSPLHIYLKKKKTREGTLHKCRREARNVVNINSKSQDLRKQAVPDFISFIRTWIHSDLKLNLYEMKMITYK